MGNGADQPMKSVWHGGSVVLDDMQVSQDAADFLALYGTDVERIRSGFNFVSATMPAGRDDLAKHWERVAARVGEMIAGSGRRLN